VKDVIGPHLLADAVGVALTSMDPALAPDMSALRWNLPLAVSRSF